MDFSLFYEDSQISETPSNSSDQRKNIFKLTKIMTKKQVN